MEIVYVEDTTSIFCRFLNQQDTTDKSCSIDYVQCQQRLISTPKQLNATETNTPNMLLIFLKFDDSDEGTYCYDVMASNSSYTLHVYGTLNHGKKAVDHIRLLTYSFDIIGHSSRVANTNIGAIIGGTVGIFIAITVAVIVASFISK